MVIVDPRRGSKELAKFFGNSVELCEEYLDFGDFFFAGNGPVGDVAVGVERKALGDFLTCMDDERFTGYQLPNLLKSYNYTFVIIEGIYRPTADGYIDVCLPTRDRFGNESSDYAKWRRLYRGKRAPLYSQLEGHLNTLRLKAGTPNAGFVVIQTTDSFHTAQSITALYNWFAKPWEEHRSHIGFYDPATIFRAESSFERRCFMQFEGIGYEKSGLIEVKFPGQREPEAVSPMEQIMAASEKELATIDGIGKASAERIYRTLHWRNEPKPEKKTRKAKSS
jgi:ERCC4-type nuclease